MVKVRMRMNGENWKKGGKEETEFLRERWKLCCVCGGGGGDR